MCPCDINPAAEWVFKKRKKKPIRTCEPRTERALLLLSCVMLYYKGPPPSRKTFSPDGRSRQRVGVSNTAARHKFNRLEAYQRTDGNEVATQRPVRATMHSYKQARRACVNTRSPNRIHTAPNTSAKSRSARVTADEPASPFQGPFSTA